MKAGYSFLLTQYACSILQYRCGGSLFEGRTGSGSSRSSATPLAGNVHVSKLGVIPKKHQPGKWRLIVDFSSPKGASINDFIDPSFCSLTYASVEDAAAYVFKAGQGALLAKLDIKSAYRNIPVYPGDRHLLGVCWQGRTLVCHLAFKNIQCHYRCS